MEEMETTNTQPGIQRKPYETPRLQEYGDLAELTKGPGIPGGDFAEQAASGEN